jgi:hypothetical protein
MVLATRPLVGGNPNVVVDVERGRRLLVTEQHTADLGARGAVDKILVLI